LTGSNPGFAAFFDMTSTNSHINLASLLGSVQDFKNAFDQGVARRPTSLLIQPSIARATKEVTHGCAVYELKHEMANPC
jgi:hypothetical protein